MIENAKLRIAVIAILVGLPIISHAKTLMCPFIDKFTLSVPAHVKIISAAPQNIFYDQTSDINFELSCSDDPWLSGDLLIKVGYDYENLCSLTVHDGPWEMHPSVTTVSCKGTKLAYIGMDAHGSRDYTLKFTS